MKVYHGSYLAIDTIDFSCCKKRRDFGKGFYVTKLLPQADYWAARKGEDNDTDGVVTAFEFDEDFFEDEDLQTLRFDGYSEEWLDFVVLNRKNRKGVQAHNYDIIEGPVADDDIATRVFDYVNGKVSKNQFLKELTHKAPSHQICFCTLQSLQAIKKVETYDFAYNLKNITREILKRLITDKGLDKADAADKLYNSDVFSQLSDKTTKFHEKDWEELYKLLLDELDISK
ncbi:MAG: DUF3990 domain-containing protein [Candidatus Symbiothrix sp.]|jgi:hypothetical protein|nr:DUF3990 domain-containing protein [Candidatus Symbiothrix sp.]